MIFVMSLKTGKPSLMYVLDATFKSLIESTTGKIVSGRDSEETSKAFGGRLS